MKPDLLLNWSWSSCRAHTVNHRSSRLTYTLSSNPLMCNCHPHASHYTLIMPDFLGYNVTLLLLINDQSQVIIKCGHCPPCFCNIFFGWASLSLESGGQSSLYVCFLFFVVLVATGVDSNLWRLKLAKQKWLYYTGSLYCY